MTGLPLIDAALLVDAVLVISVVEAVVLVTYHRRSGKGVAPAEFLLNLVSGLSLMLALRGAVGAAGPIWIAACLLAAGLAHGLDLLRRWKR